MNSKNEFSGGIMKKIGLIGGTGWISTAEYYRLINEMVNARLGGLQFAECIIYSFNYGDIDAFNKRNDDKGVSDLLIKVAPYLEHAGAECLVLCANTLHKYVDELSNRIHVPIIHIAEATANQIKRDTISKVGLLGTRATMEGAFYRDKLAAAGIETLVPDKEDREFIHNTIMEELLKNNIRAESKARFLRIIDNLQNNGAKGIILGCTEIPLIVKSEDTRIKLYNTLEIHCEAIVDYALAN
jgi:aspartate racemase